MSEHQPGGHIAPARSYPVIEHLTEFASTLAPGSATRLFIAGCDLFFFLFSEAIPIQGCTPNCCLLRIPLRMRQKKNAGPKSSFYLTVETTFFIFRPSRVENVVWPQCRAGCSLSFFSAVERRQRTHSGERTGMTETKLRTYDSRHLFQEKEHSHPKRRIDLLFIFYSDIKWRGQFTRGCDFLQSLRMIKASDSTLVCLDRRSSLPSAQPL